MKVSKADIYTRRHAIASIRFEDQKLTSFSGLVVFQKLFERLDLSRKVKGACSHLDRGRSYCFGSIVELLIVHVLLGCRKLREMDFYRDDPMVKLLLRLKRLPGVATVSRMLREFDAESVEKHQELNRRMVVDRLGTMQLRRVTLDFDGSVQSTKRHAEGTAVGFNKKKKGARSYYPLFCTVAQTGQVLDVLHRSGNVHDSNGAREFVLQCVRYVRGSVPGVIFEVRMDSAFFSDDLVELLNAEGVEYTISVPFMRFGKLKELVEARKVVKYHEGRGYQENIFAELKSQGAMDYIPVRTWIGNKIYLLCNLLAHNLVRELQMQANEPARTTSEKRTPLWIFEGLAVIRRTIIQRAGRVTTPCGVRTLTMSANEAVQRTLLHYLAAA